MATQAELMIDGGAERRSVLGMIRGWLTSRDLRAFVIALGLALVVFAGLLLLSGKDPIATYIAIYNGTLGDSYGWGEIVVKMIPFILCALATAIPARVGLVNVGGEGQIYMTLEDALDRAREYMTTRQPTPVVPFPAAKP